MVYKWLFLTKKFLQKTKQKKEGKKNVTQLHKQIFINQFSEFFFSLF